MLLHCKQENLTRGITQAIFYIIRCKQMAGVIGYIDLETLDLETLMPEPIAKDHKAESQYLWSECREPEYFEDDNNFKNESKLVFFLRHCLRTDSKGIIDYFDALDLSGLIEGLRIEDSASDVGQSG